MISLLIVAAAAALSFTDADLDKVGTPNVVHERYVPVQPKQCIVPGSYEVIDWDTCWAVASWGSPSSTEVWRPDTDNKYSGHIIRITHFCDDHFSRPWVPTVVLDMLQKKWCGKD
jgi:hypothetical protein